MGWLWASQSATKTPSPTRDQSSNLPTAPPPSSSSKASDWETDPEIQKFLALFQTDVGSKQDEKVPEATPAPTRPSTQTQTPAPKSSLTSWLPSLHASSSSSQTNNRTAEVPPLLNPVAESLLPTEMSCRQAFDIAYHCQSIGGQWNAVYRHGQLQSCSQQWDDFWFCMRVKGYTGKTKEDEIRAHYRKKEYTKYGNGKPSSEDIWQTRAAKVAPGTTFLETFNKPDMDDDEWQLNEIARRKMFRRELGYET